MWRGELKPLDANLWFAQVRELARYCSTAPKESDAQAIRRAYHLVKVAPLALRRTALASTQIEEMELEGILESGRMLQAAQRTVAIVTKIVDAPCNSNKSQAIFVDDAERADRFVAASPALAVIGIWAEYISSLAA